MALPTSGTYNFLSITAEVIIREAFENIGISPEFRDFQKMDSARRSLNLINIEWMSKSYNLWTIESGFVPLVTGQSTYTLPPQVSDVIEMNTRTYNVPVNILTSLPYITPSASISRQLGGTPQTNTTDTYDNGGGGVAENAFDDDLNTACTQNVQNGNISYDFGGDFIVGSVGILSSVDRLYTILVEYSDDHINWDLAMALEPYEFISTQTVTYTIPDPVAARYYRIREIGGATLSMTEIYFDTGVASNAFDGNPATACTQTVANGQIVYRYNTIIGPQAQPNITQYITSVGITSNVTRDYTLRIVAYDPILGQDTVLLNVPTQSYPKGVPQWFTISSPINITKIGIVETGGAILDINEIQFANNENDIVMTQIGMYEYQTYPNKTTQSRPTVYVVNRQYDAPELMVWPTPMPMYTLLQYTYKQMIQDVNSLSQTIQIPARFYPAMIWGLSYRLAVKYRPDLMQTMKMEYEESFRIATTEDSEAVPYNFEIDWTYL